MEYVTKPQPPNPNPKNFNILRLEQIGIFVCSEILYPDCTSFEGKKIIVFVNTTENEVRKMNEIDPHFAWDSHVFARFHPNAWNVAIDFCRSIKP